MSNMTIPTIEAEGVQTITGADINTASTELFPFTDKKPENVSTQNFEVKPLEDIKEPVSEALIENDSPSEKKVAPLQFIIGPQITQAQVLNDRRATISLGKLNGEKLPLAV